MTLVSLSEGLATTRSIRRYSDAPVTDEQLAQVMHLATRAPSGSNRQPFRFIVLRNGPKASTVRDLLAEGARDVWETKRSKGEFGEPAPGSRTDRMLTAMEDYVATFAAAPVIVLPCMVRYRAPTPTEGASVYPAVQNMLLGARAAGLGGALTMFHQTREDEIRSTLGVPDAAFIAATVTLGVPAGRHGPVRRKPLSQLVYEDCWEGQASWAVDPDGTRFTGGPKG